MLLARKCIHHNYLGFASTKVFKLKIHSYIFKIPFILDEFKCISNSNTVLHSSTHRIYKNWNNLDNTFRITLDTNWTFDLIINKIKTTYLSAF